MLPWPRILLLGLRGTLKQKSPVAQAFAARRLDDRPCLQRLDVRGGRTLGALGHVERDPLRFREGLVAVHLDRAVVREQILPAVIRRDESEALRVVEPLNGTCCHVHASFFDCETIRSPAYGHDDQGRELNCHFGTACAAREGRRTSLLENHCARSLTQLRGGLFGTGLMPRHWRFGAAYE